MPTRDILHLKLVLRLRRKTRAFLKEEFVEIIIFDISSVTLGERSVQKSFLGLVRAELAKQEFFRTQVETGGVNHGLMAAKRALTLTMLLSH